MGGGGDLPGTWMAEVMLNDNARGTSIPLKTQFKLVKVKTKKKNVPVQ